MAKKLKVTLTAEWTISKTDWNSTTKYLKDAKKELGDRLQFDTGDVYNVLCQISWPEWDYKIEEV